jgi:hypothetical protein
VEGREIWLLREGRVVNKKRALDTPGGTLIIEDWTPAEFRGRGY